MTPIPTLPKPFPKYRSGGGAGRAPAAPHIGHPLAVEDKQQKAHGEQDNKGGQPVVPPGVGQSGGVVIALQDAGGQLVVNELTHIHIEVGEGLVGHLIGDRGGLVTLASKRQAQGVVLQGEGLDLLLEEVGPDLTVGRGLRPVHLLKAGDSEDHQQDDQQIEGQVAGAHSFHNGIMSFPAAEIHREGPPKHSPWLRGGGGTGGYPPYTSGFRIPI